MAVYDELNFSSY